MLSHKKPNTNIFYQNILNIHKPYPYIKNHKQRNIRCTQHVRHNPCKEPTQNKLSISKAKPPKKTKTKKTVVYLTNHTSYRKNLKPIKPKSKPCLHTHTNNLTYYRSNLSHTYTHMHKVRNNITNTTYQPTSTNHDPNTKKIKENPPNTLIRKSKIIKESKLNHTYIHKVNQNINKNKQHRRSTKQRKNIYTHISTNSTLKPKTKTEITKSLHTNQVTYLGLKSDAPSNLSKTIYTKQTLPTKIISIHLSRMTGQGKGATRILTEDPNFVMLNTSSPPQGQKRTGGTKPSSEEKRSKSTLENRGKSIPTEKNLIAHQFWLGFEAMEKLAIDEGAPNIIDSAPIKRKGRYEKEADELFASVFSYPHVGQTLYPLIRPDGIEGQHYNISNYHSK